MMHDATNGVYMSEMKRNVELQKELDLANGKILELTSQLKYFYNEWYEASGAYERTLQKLLAYKAFFGDIPIK